MPDDKKKNDTDNTYEMQSGITDNKNHVGFDKLEFLLDIPLEISVELGRTKLVINDLLKLAQGSIIELSKVAGETMDILANQRLIAKGEVVSINEKYGVRLTEIISHKERLEKIR
jgi:flagellar motor switch protein FliN/FliY